MNVAVRRNSIYPSSTIMNITTFNSNALTDRAPLIGAGVLQDICAGISLSDMIKTRHMADAEQ